MAKKAREEPVSPRKVPDGPTQPVDNKERIVGDKEENGIGKCRHYSKSSVELNMILLRIIADSEEPSLCENCREEPSSRKRAGKEKKGKQKTKKEEAKSESGFVWACLDCGKCFCGGVISDSAPYGHARRHSNQERHRWAARADNPGVGWCYMCNSGFQLDLSLVVPVVEDKSSENGVGNLKMEGLSRRIVRGLSNLGNTCFFNSVMQNLFALDMLRDSLVNLDKTVGPLSMAMKKIFEETSGAAETRGVLSPNSLFGCISSKSPQFRGHNQQDSHELLRYLLDGLHVEEISAGKSESSCDEEVKTTLQSTNSLVDKIFGGQLSSTVCCAICGHTSTVLEPFLDLSLPVPSKKTPPKKISPPPKKQALKYRSKSIEFSKKKNEKRSVVLEEQTTDSIVSIPEPEQNIDKEEDEVNEDCKSGIPASSKQENTVPEMMGFSSMDYLDEPSTSIIALDSGTGNVGDSAVKDFDLGDSGKPQKLDNLHTSSESQVDNMSKDLIVSQDSSGDNYSSDEVNSLSMQVSVVILLPYGEINPNKEITNLTTIIQNPHSTSSVGESSSHLSMQLSTMANSEQEEVETHGLGALFDEPEVTSDAKGNKFCDSNQEEVDNSNAPVSVNSCLALFTKPELLTGDHAWYCKHCSEVSSYGINGKKKEKVHTEVVGSQHEMKKIASNLQVSCLIPFDSEASGCADKASTSGMDSNFEPICTLTKATNTFGGLGDATDGEATGDRELLLKRTFSDGQHSIVLVAENQDIVGSDTIATTMQKSSNMNGSLTVDEDEVSCIQAQEGPSRSLPSNDDSVGSNSVRNDNCEVNGAQKICSKRLDQLRQVKESRVASKEAEKGKVKRDATKRILINRLPFVLTIHLKRFSQDARGRLTKLRGHVCFQETLDLRPYLDPRCEEKEKCTYRLVGVVEHSGTMGFGHYVAYVRGEMGKGKTAKDIGPPCWFYASDTHVRSTSLSEVLRSEAYILFYERA